MPEKTLSLQEKLVEIRKACPHIAKEKHNPVMPYKYAVIHDVWAAITPAMNTHKVNFDVTAETPVKTDNGNSIYLTTIVQSTRTGDRQMFLYEAHLTIRWTNAEAPTDIIETTVYAVGWNDDPAKAKGSAHTYALKYYLFEKFSIDQGEDDPDHAKPQTPVAPPAKVSNQPPQDDMLDAIGRKYLWALCEKDEPLLKTVIKTYGYDSTKDIKASHKDAIAEAIKKAVAAKRKAGNENDGTGSGTV